MEIVSSVEILRGRIGLRPVASAVPVDDCGSRCLSGIFEISPGEDDNIVKAAGYVGDCSRLDSWHEMCAAVFKLIKSGKIASVIHSDPGFFVPSSAPFSENVTWTNPLLWPRRAEGNIREGHYGLAWIRGHWALLCGIREKSSMVDETHVVRYEVLVSECQDRPGDKFMGATWADSQEILKELGRFDAIFVRPA